jgi:prolyl oligopeptidase
LRGALLLAALLPACALWPGAAKSDTAAAAALHRLFADEWERGLREDPELAASVGDRRYNDRWPGIAPADFERRQATDRAVLQQLGAIDRGALTPGDQLNYDLFRDQYQRRVDGQRFRDFLMPLNHMAGVHRNFDLDQTLTFGTPKDYEDWLARMQQLGGFIDQHIALMRTGIEEHRVQACASLQRVPEQLQLQIVDTPDASPWFAPFRTPSGLGLDAPSTARLQDRARSVILATVVPAYRRLAEFFNREYLPACRTQPAAGALPDGPAYYAWLVRQRTTTELSPDQIHALGLHEVARIRALMEKAVHASGFDGSLEDFQKAMRDNTLPLTPAAQPYSFATPEACLTAYRALAKEVDPALVKLFRRMPRTPYGVYAVPRESAANSPGGFYQPPADDGSRGGAFYVNLHGTPWTTTPRFGMEALVLHETVPGHHFQIALAQELPNLPDFRRHSLSTAYIEGWGLYSESLGEALGFYRNPYTQYGRYTAEILRAARLVVDTGLHHLGWPRQQAIDYLVSVGAAPAQAINETDRYIAWPAQALAYKVGELKIQELRARAQEKLGARFDVKAFHDTVLGSGALPLETLERLVDEWIAASAEPDAESPGAEPAVMRPR